VEAKVSELYGLILVGGKSLRMKQPKAELVFDQKPQWQVCQEILMSLCGQVFFSVSKNFSLNYQNLIPDIFLDPIGPLGGMISAFKKYPEKTFFILACDLPFFDQEAASFLIENHNPKKQATLFKSDQGLEPLCGIYESSVFKYLLSAYIEKIYCPKKIIEKLDIAQVTPKKASWIRNINDEHEFLKIQKNKKQIRVYYYASLREATKIPCEILRTNANTLEKLYLELKERYGFLLDQEQLRFCKNNQLVGPVSELFDQDEVVFIPPVCGG
jgi:molybdopterin-guanine dinucleotide biosynthesis protein A